MPTKLIQRFQQVIDLRQRWIDLVNPRSEPVRESVVLGGIVERTGYLPHSESVGFIWTADALLLFLSDLPGAGRILTGKIFEYLAARKPILAVVPEGEAADLIRSTGAGIVVSPQDPAGIEAAIEHLAGGSFVLPNHFAAESFSRHQTSRTLAAVLNGLTKDSI